MALILLPFQTAPFQMKMRLFNFQKRFLLTARFYSLILFLILSGLSCPLQSQEIDYARNVIDTLASDAYKGRGYVDQADKKAADFIKKEFQKFGLQPFSNNYFQPFEVSVNTFPHPLIFAIQDDTLKPGYDFLVEPGSPSIKDSFDTITITAEEMRADETLIPKLRQSVGKMIVIPPFNANKYSKEDRKRIDGIISFLKFHENNPAEGTVILTNEKLTWSASTRLYPKPVFTAHADSISSPFDQITIDVENEFHSNYQTQNVVGFIEGENQDSLIVFIAHYDHLGMLGTDAVFNGANDNASGVAMFLSLARHYSINKPNFTTAFLAFSAEELGLLGSKYFTENPLFELSRIKFLINFDLAGTGDDGIQVVNGSVYNGKFEKLGQLNEDLNLLPQIKIRGAACISDHCWFDRNEVPNFYIYTLGGIPAYHDVHDRPETLPLTEFEDYFSLITKFIDEL